MFPWGDSFSTKARSGTGGAAHAASRSRPAANVGASGAAAGVDASGAVAGPGTEAPLPGSPGPLGRLATVIASWSPGSRFRLFGQASAVVAPHASGSQPQPAASTMPAAAPAVMINAGSGAKLEQLRAVLGADVATGFGSFTEAFDYFRLRAPKYGFAVIIKSATGSASSKLRALETGTLDASALSKLNAYGFFSIVCSRNGEATGEGSGQRASRTAKCGCTFAINMSRKKSKTSMLNPVTISFDSDSTVFAHNHPMLPPEEAKLLAPARFVPDALQASLTRLARQPGLSAGEVHRLLKAEAEEAKLDVTWTLEDVAQARYKAQGNHATGDAFRAVEVLRKLQQDGQASYDVTLNEQGQLTALVWQTKAQVCGGAP